MILNIIDVFKGYQTCWRWNLGLTLRQSSCFGRGWDPQSRRSAAPATQWYSRTKGVIICCYIPSSSWPWTSFHRWVSSSSTPSNYLLHARSFGPRSCALGDHYSWAWKHDSALWCANYIL